MNTEEIKYQQAKERVAALRDFYIHLGVYVIVNLMLFLRNVLTTPETLWFYWPLIGWGVALVLHGLSIFSGARLFGASWEEKKIREILERDENE